MTTTEKINKVLEEKGIAREKLLSDLKIKPELYSNWENGTKIPVIKLAKIAGYLNVPMESLFGDLVLTAEDKKIIADYRDNPTPKNLLAILKIMDGKYSVQLDQLIKYVREEAYNEKKD